MDKEDGNLPLEIRPRIVLRRRPTPYTFKQKLCQDIHYMEDKLAKPEDWIPTVEYLKPPKLRKKLPSINIACIRLVAFR